MTSIQSFLSIGFGLILLLDSASNGIAQTVTPSSSQSQEPVSPAAELARQYPKGSITTIELANKASEDSERARAAVDARYTQEERDCLSRFFATSCLDGAKERKRFGKQQIKQVELEASAFKRRYRAFEREKSAAQRNERARGSNGGKELKPDAEKASGPVDNAK